MNCCSCSPLGPAGKSIHCMRERAAGTVRWSAQLQKMKGWQGFCRKPQRSWSPRNSFKQLRRKEAESVLPKRAPVAGGMWQRRHGVVLRPQRWEGDGTRAGAPPPAPSAGLGAPSLLGRRRERGQRRPVSFCRLRAFASAAALWKVTVVVAFF